MLSSALTKLSSTFLRPACLELDFELVALDDGDGAVAELAVEHALAERQVGAALVAEADGGGPRFDHALRLGVEIAARLARCQPGPRVLARIDCAGPRWAKGSARSDHCARHRLSPPVIVVSSSICALGSSARKRLGMRAGPLAVNSAVGGVDDRRIAGERA